VEPLRTDGLDHVAITVEDLERSHAFYSGVIGLERAYDEWHVPVFMLAGGSGLALFPRESHPGSGDDSSVPEIRVMHIAFRVDREQFDRARAELPSAGFEYRFADHGACHSIYFPDPDGHEIELTTYEV
jgi:catechol 2,3-dioxygenase-like lactoylglutathione lyase family enzyme